MKQFLLSISLLCIGLSANAQITQAFRSSLMQYQFNALPLNPAYAGRLEATSFEAFYYGGFSSKQQISRSALVSLHGRGGANQNLGWGGVMQFHNQAYFNELAFRPAFSRIFQLGGGNLSFGATAGVTYIDIDESIASNLTNSYFSLSTGAGVLWHNQRSFIGISLPKFWEKSGSDEEAITSDIMPVNVHLGSVFRITDEYFIKPAILLNRQSQEVSNILTGIQKLTTQSADLHLSVFIEGAYVIGGMVGISDVDNGIRQTRLGASATFLFDNFRFGYAVQFNNQAVSSISLPTMHTISAGYDFFENPEDGRRVF
ncbi:MAG: type IX secretion system membrane protein PorP/SprF [Saprospiraceae bacterium]|nr:type IX secretion system membrane protein PorP/SprF [Saprospiraceae bacterium]